MIKKYSIYIACIGSLLLSGCSNDLLQTEGDDALVPIVFSASGITVSMEEQVQTKATTDFPHNGEMMIIAANANSTTINWSSPYTGPIPATAGSKNGEKYPVSITTGSLLWPSHTDGYLGFVAYSPRAGGMLSVVIDSNNTKLRIAPGGNVSTFTYPDLLCTDPIGPLSKGNGEVKDGEVNLPFNHVMAQVEINVIAIDDKGEEITTPASPITITSLTLETQTAGGTFNLTDGTWSIDNPVGTFSTFCTLITNEDIPQKGVSCLLLPGTEDNVQVSISLEDASGATVSASHVISEFSTTAASLKKEETTPASLEKGEKSVLTIKVKMKDISIALEGDLAPWDYKGNSEVTIE